MEYLIYKFEFLSGVHFGTGALNESAYTFTADRLFSALYIESLKLGMENVFYDAVQRGALLFSDMFPYVGQQYMVPKPMLYVDSGKQGDSKQKKAYKKLKFLPVEKMDEFLAGQMDLTENPMEHYGYYRQQTMAHVRREEDTLPYRVGTFYYAKDCGLYILVAHESPDEINLLEELLAALSYTGIGGKKNVGLGKFMLKKGKPSVALYERMQKESERSMLLSGALPVDAELEQALLGASYLLDKRSGFVASADYAEEWRKKKDLYVFAAGSCFEHKFTGDIYDVSDGGGLHAVYRYAKALFMGV